MGMGGLFVHLGCLSYLTALAFSTILPIPIWGSLLLLNTVAVVYTISGGMKAVIWTDCLQSFVMLFSQSFLAFKLWAVLGVGKVWEVSGMTSSI